MKIRLLSDLHTEFRVPRQFQDYLEYKGEDVLILAGDIASGSTNTVDVIKQFKKAGFPKILYVPGNHEYYGTSLEDFDTKIERKISELDDVYLLNPNHVVIDDVVFIGGTLWTNFRDDFIGKHAAKNMISDFRLINGFSPDMAVEKYEQHLSYFKSVYEMYPDKKKVIVSHFLPAVECISPRFNDGNLLNYYFANNLGNWIGNMSNTTWMFGHTHDKIDVMVGDTRCVANPYGYWGHEVNSEFEHFYSVEV